MFIIIIFVGFLEACLEEVSVGNCADRQQRFYYDPIEKKCKNFFFSGCLGNGNNFLTLQACKSFCIKDEPNRTINQKFDLLNKKLLKETNKLQTNTFINDNLSFTSTKIYSNISSDQPKNFNEPSNINTNKNEF